MFEPISRLAKSLAEVLANDGARSHFCSYLEARDAVNLVKFWQEVKGEMARIYSSYFTVHSKTWTWTKIAGLGRQRYAL